MTICILSLEPHQRIPRPFNRAYNEAEMVELVDAYLQHYEKRGFIACRFYEDVGTESPVATIHNGIATVQFYAFTEE